MTVAGEVVLFTYTVTVSISERSAVIGTFTGTFIGAPVLEAKLVIVEGKLESSTQFETLLYSTV